MNLRLQRVEEKYLCVGGNLDEAQPRAKCVQRVGFGIHRQLANLGQTLKHPLEAAGALHVHRSLGVGRH